MLSGELLQIIGLVLVTTLTTPADRDWPGLYGFQVCIGFGMGLVIGTTTLLTPALTERRDLATASAAVVQSRFLGGAVILSIASAQLQALFESTETTYALAGDVQGAVEGRFVESFNLQMRIVLRVAVAAMLSSLMMWQKPQVRVP
ncbi:hypothetical protein QQS21_010590 [Conoideocrella luteorostrata]|uniref:Uncharacterized protein n=1 Tax=Conoideocrella luteorostrata TaxID=1105319 RepID=A0AAJ0FWP5_9HYPO|nr:hypothetical protein QQS21_010590 [Conoideocrella luteorostrata]